MRKTFNSPLEQLKNNEVYIYFGTTVGRLQSKIASKFGAREGVVSGINNEKTYAIPAYTYNAEKPVDVKFLERKILELYLYAIKNPRKTFLVSFWGIDLINTKLSKKEMGLLFSKKTIPDNIIFDSDFNNYIV